ncbi:Hypothetical Protein FCC1311_026132 [Hondaea fermentalgiana]|uniref:Uncharacterized protein n=1 Tax=Hondaea fermentalgiana TaxID=2315210 RepID=A0A2R5G5Q5_9STRA|nr:Hypothetical Protein FCC1311_026132 [Hondaea fermentalgiana]|eukprot:GBG26392.1 Hypothetical Protein FCC1311_026132 [Hondaea fermentalgiana]
MGLFGNKRQEKYDFEVPSRLEPCGDRVIMTGSFPRKFKGCMNEVEWRKIRHRLDEVVNGEQTYVMRRSLSNAHRRIYFCMLAVAIGFMAGFLCSFLGASLGAELVTGLGIMFVGVFIGSLILMIRTSFLINTLYAAYVDMVFDILNAQTIPRLQAEHPMLQFEIVSIGRKGKICSIRVRPSRGLASYTSVNTGVATIYSPVTAALAPMPGGQTAAATSFADPYAYQHHQRQYDPAAAQYGASMHQGNFAMHAGVVEAHAVPEPLDMDLKPNRTYYSMAAHAV